MKKICTLSDSHLVMHAARNFRKMLGDGFEFVGEWVDLNGLNHCSRGGDSTLDVIDRMDEVPSSDIYIICLGTNDGGLSFEQSLSNLERIVTELFEKSTQCEVLIMTTLPSKLDSDGRIHNLAELIRTHEWQTGVVVVDTHQVLLDDTGEIRHGVLWNKDGIHLTARGLYLVVTETLKYL